MKVEAFPMLQKTSDPVAFQKAAEAIEEGELSRLNQVLGAKPELVNQAAEQPTEDGRSPGLLHIAASIPVGRQPANLYKAVTCLINHGAPPDALDQGRQGSTALQWAAYGNLMEVAAILIEAGASIDPLSIQGDCMSALTLALFEGHQGMAAFLRERGAKTSFEDDAALGDLKAMNDFFAEKKNQNGQQAVSAALKAQFLSAFLYACKNGQVAAVQLLLEQGVDINLFPPGAEWGGIGGSGLHWAVAHQHAALVRFLVEQGADLEAKDDVWNRTPLQWAEEGGNQEIASILREKRDT